MNSVDWNPGIYANPNFRTVILLPYFIVTSAMCGGFGINEILSAVFGLAFCFFADWVYLEVLCRLKHGVGALVLMATMFLLTLAGIRLVV